MGKELWHSVRGRAVRPNMHPTFVISSADDVEPSFATIEDDRPAWGDRFDGIAGYACVIAYENAKGEASQRLITCQRKDVCAGEVYLWAWCHSRARVRQFRLSRITGVFDPATGEDLGDPAALFESFVSDRVQQSKPGWGLGVRQRADLSALLNVLVFVARCDRDYHPLEREKFEDAVCRFWIRSEATGEPDCEAIQSHCDRLAPDAETFYVALHRCAENPKLARLLRDSVRSVIDADGRIAREEVYWGSAIDEFFRERG